MVVVENDKSKAISNQNAMAFFLLGLANNAPFTIMNAGAKEISNGGVGLVYVVNIVPCFLVQIFGPYIFPYISYRARVRIIVIAMLSSLVIVGMYSHSLRMQLLGVSITSFQVGLGEASMLGLTNNYKNSIKCITGWSSGTGVAGMFGYFFVILLNSILGFSFSTVCFLACFLAMLYVFAFFYVLGPIETDEPIDTDGLIDISGKGFLAKSRSSLSIQYRPLLQDSAEVLGRSKSSVSLRRYGPLLQDSGVLARSRSSEQYRPLLQDYKETPADADTENGKKEIFINADHNIIIPKVEEFESSWAFYRTLALYMLPLTIVYSAEYSCQSGTWSSMGFPITSKSARDKFYQYSNFCYQIGVFISRTSGSFIRFSLPTVYTFSLSQVVLLLFFIMNSVQFYLYNWDILFLCFIVGLLGGACYVNVFSLISTDFPDSKKEFALSIACVGATIGMIIADVFGLVIQACIYKLNGLGDTVGECPI